ncbi:MAG TPA: carboxypeptidase-like regulatory domain-containing protein [Caldisericia bacterium]|nr:carboxypeptidase-like regulatory domain-containing protein [Caldisericia bacterium]HPF48856.1 carboxypeptidase-like regulatory domain-containing protein [Caldisericia bacterium]HPI83280.1 carboxypeptidase-like regulatory domain-containing protein [Caldisericia bacterium]HPQ92507.1 carboxypeptidase-like regulatory domain-containing protein [Caldisericia bacterium]HRV74395.1 carboxypeptidase-like regulatory domain-containing protein [Caldisericia bacterium]
MKKITILALVLFVVLISFAACGGSGETYRLEGKVVDSVTSEPIYDARVSLDGVIAKTDEKGKYAFDSIREGKCNIEFKAAGYESREFTDYEINENKFLNTMLIPEISDEVTDNGNSVDGGYKNPEYPDIPEPPPPPGNILDKKPEFTKYTKYDNLRVSYIESVASSNTPREPLIVNIAGGISQTTMRDPTSGEAAVLYADGNATYEKDADTDSWRKIIHPKEVGDQINPLHFAKMYFNFLFDVIESKDTVVSSLPETTINGKSYTTYYISGIDTNLTVSYSGEVYLSPGNPTIVGIDGKFYQNGYSTDFYALLDKFGEIESFTLPQTDDVIDLSDMSAPPGEMTLTPPEEGGSESSTQP